MVPEPARPAGEIVTWIRAPLALFLVACVAIGGVVGAALAMRGAVRASDAAFAGSALALSDAERLRGWRERISRKARTYLLLGEDRFLIELHEAERAFDRQLSSLQREARTSEERDLLSRLQEGESIRHSITERLILARRVGASTDSITRATEAELQPTLDTLDANILNLIEHHQRAVARARAESTTTFSRASRGLWLSAGLTLFAAALTSWALSRSLKRIHGRAEQLRRERDRIFETSPDLVCVAGLDGFFKQINPAFETVLGYSSAELLNRPFIELVHDEDRAATLSEVENLSKGRATVDFENRCRCKDGQYRWLSWHATPDATGAIYAVGRDVTERKATEEKLASLNEELRVMAVIDELTGLHNRRGFQILCEQYLKLVSRNRQVAVFFFADVDGLKQINDQLGHEAGDAAIRDAGTILTSAFRNSDIVARLGGDEFVVLAPNAAADTIQILAQRVEEAVRQHNLADPSRPYVLSISVGATLYDPAQPETIDAILKRADEMMYKQKAQRKARNAASPLPEPGRGPGPTGFSD